jgi:gentisate 1,2-dioxygenase
VIGLYLRFADYQIIDGQILEIPPLGQTASQRHFYEKGIYYISGLGHTVIQQEGESPKRVDWTAGAVLSIPLNVRYQHFNDGTEPARLLAVTSFPFVINAVDNVQFIEENPFVMRDRYDGAEDYLDRSHAVGELNEERNFVEDARGADLRPYELRGAGSHTIRWDMAGNRMLSLHVAEMEAGTYRKAHRHSSDAFILILSGKGFSVTWPEGRYDKRKRIDWQAGTLFVPPTYWYHQHLNTGPTPARHLAINAPVLVRNLGLRFEDQLEQDIPEIRQAWEKELSQER